LLIDRYAAGLPMFRVAQLVHPALNLALEKHYDATLADKRFFLAIVTRVIDQCYRCFSRFPVWPARTCANTFPRWLARVNDTCCDQPRRITFAHDRARGTARKHGARWMAAFDPNFSELNAERHRVENDRAGRYVNLNVTYHAVPSFFRLD
jgi:hypothetical protein